MFRIIYIFRPNNFIISYFAIDNFNKLILSDLYYIKQNRYLSYIFLQIDFFSPSKSAIFIKSLFSFFSSLILFLCNNYT